MTSDSIAMFQQQPGDSGADRSEPKYGNFGYFHN